MAAVLESKATLDRVKKAYSPAPLMVDLATLRQNNHFADKLRAALGVKS